MEQKILAGTAKGLVEYLITPDGVVKFVKVHFVGFSVNMIHCDETMGRWWVGISHRHWGQKLHYSDDKGLTWEAASVPSYKGYSLHNEQPARMHRIWCLQNGGATRPGHLWMGTDPGGLFFSDDYGRNFELVDSLWNHPSRKIDNQWFGAGSDFPFIHSIVLDPRNSDHVYVAVSCAGVFKTEDGGKSWSTKNKGLKAAYLPNPHVEVGHDPHRLLMSPKNPSILWQQNHCGIYVSTDGGAEWKDVSGQNGFPSYGFALAIDDEDPAKAWVFPVESDENRIAPDLRLQVLATMDFGAHWQDDSQGLPIDHTFDIVLRHAASKKDQTFVMGTANGNLYSRNRKEGKWQTISTNLTKVNTIQIV